MPKINVYLPDDLAAEVRQRALPVSAICQAALRAHLDTDDETVRLRLDDAVIERLAQQIATRLKGETEPSKII